MNKENDKNVNNILTIVNKNSDRLAEIEKKLYRDSHNNRNDTHWSKKLFYIILDITILFANVGIVYGIYYAKKQYELAETNSLKQFKMDSTTEKTKNALDLVEKASSNEFLINYAIFKSESQSNKLDNKGIHAMNYIANTYYTIAIIYNENKIADNLLIGKLIKENLDGFITDNYFKDYSFSGLDEIKEMNDNINSTQKK